MPIYAGYHAARDAGALVGAVTVQLRLQMGGYSGAVDAVHVEDVTEDGYDGANYAHAEVECTAGWSDADDMWLLSTAATSASFGTAVGAATDDYESVLIVLPVDDTDANDFVLGSFPVSPGNGATGSLTFVIPSSIIMRDEEAA
jgi:hypothetical protein